MAENMKFCRSCGNQISADAPFCRFCGFKFDAPAQQTAPKQTTSPDAGTTASAQQSIQGKMKASLDAGRQKDTVAQTPTPKNAPATRFCNQCGKQINADAPFCRFCGAKLDIPSQSSAASAASAVGTPVQDISAAVKNAIQVTAPKAAGEVAIGNALGVDSLTVGGVDLGNAAQKATAILSPLKTIGGGVKSFFGGIGGIFKSPKQAVLPLLLGVLWVVIPILKNAGMDNTAINGLSWLTFSEGGLNRGTAGMLGGILGKGSVAVLFSSLFSGGLKSGVKGIGTLFTGGGEKRSIPAILIGALLGAVLGAFYMGLDTGMATSMAGISGLLLSLQSLGGQGGFARQLVESLTAKTVNGVRMAQNGAINGLFTGTTAGFAAITVIAAIL